VTYWINVNQARRRQVQDDVLRRSLAVDIAVAMGVPVDRVTIVSLSETQVDGTSMLVVEFVVASATQAEMEAGVRRGTFTQTSTALGVRTLHVSLPPPNPPAEQPKPELCGVGCVVGISIAAVAMVVAAVATTYSCMLQRQTARKDHGVVVVAQTVPAKVTNVLGVVDGDDDEVECGAV
jgi:hypothetical protein